MEYGHPSTGTPEQIQEWHHAKMGNGRTEARHPQISAQCTDLSEQSETLVKLVHELEERLNTVLRPANDDRGPNAPDELRKSAELLAPHADFLQTRNNALRQAGKHLANIISRIEL